MPLPPASRNLAALAAIIPGSLALALSVAVVWLHDVVIDSKTYVDTVTPLASDPAVKDAIAAYATEDLFAQIDVEQLALDSLPDGGDMIAGPAIGAAKGAVYRQIRQELDTLEFIDVWKSANREAHSAFLQMMRGRNGTPPGEEGKILIDINQVFNLVKANLSAAGFDFLNGVQIEAGHRFAIFQIPALTRARQAFNLLDTAAFWLPATGMALLVVGVWLASRRGLAMAGAGLALAAWAALLYLGIGAVRDYYLAAVKLRGAIDLPAATSFYDIMTAPLRSLIIYVCVGGFVLGAVALLSSLMFSPWRRLGK